MRLFDRLGFALGETFIALRRNLALGFAAMMTVALSLYLLAGMTYVGQRASDYLATVPGRFEMSVFLKKNVTVADVRRTAKYLRLIPGVSNVVWIPAQRQYDLWRKANPELAEGLGDESPFAEKFRVRLNDLSKGDAVARRVGKMTTVDPVGGVQYFQEAQNAVASWIPLLRRFAYWTGGIFLAVAGVLIYTTIRLTVESRRMEVRIMRLVGASRTVVGLPFVLEGLIQGAVGGALATAALVASHRAVATKLAEMAMGATLAPFPATICLGLLCAAGGGYGGLCSLLSLRAPMRARHG